MKRILLLAGAAAAGVAAYVVLRAKTGPDPGATHRDAGVSRRDAGVSHPIGRSPAAGAPDAGAGWTRRLTPDPAGGGGSASPVPSVPFEKELRDGAWAGEHEQELTLRLRGIVDGLAARETPIDIDAIECRLAQCRVAVHAKDEAALGKFYAALETPEGLYGWADNLLLAPVERAPDGQVTTHVIAFFERERE